MYSNTAVLASSRVRKRTWWTCSVLREAKKLSIGALSRQLLRRLMDCVMPCRSSTARYGSEAYCTPRSPWWTSPREGRCRWMAMTRAPMHSSALRWSAMDQPTISRVAMSLIAPDTGSPRRSGYRRCRPARPRPSPGQALVRPVRGDVPRQQVRGDREIMAAVRGSGCTAAAPAGREPHLAHQPRDAPARMPQPFPAQLSVDAWRAVDPLAGGEDAADLRAQLGFRLGTALDGGDRVEPSVEAADARTDDSAQHGHGVVRPLGRYEGELRHAIPLAKKAAALRRISTSSSSRFT